MDEREIKSAVQKQFGDKAADYATSKVHAKGASLGRLIELIPFDESWGALDIATAAGHTAHAIAPFVNHVVATDITVSMLPKAAEIAIEKGLYNFSTRMADAEALPFDDGSFGLVTCRIAPHHFPNPDRFVQEAARVLRPGGIFALVDNIVPHTRSKKKKDQKAYTAAAEYLNAYETLRDPSHARMLSEREWRDLCRQAGLRVEHTEWLRKKMDFDPWADRMRVSAEDKTRLQVMLKQAPKIVEEFLTPEFSGDKIAFYLTELILIARKPAS